MDFSNIRLLSLMKLKMDFHAENQDVLSQNIANADTPGYKPKELKPLDFKHMALEEAHRLKIIATSPSHMSGVKPVHDFRVQEQRKTYETTPVKNSIALEEQMAKVAYNKNEFMLMTNLYRKTAQMFKTAIGNS